MPNIDVKKGSEKYGESLPAEVHRQREFCEALQDLDRFERIWLIVWLDCAKPYSMKVIPYLDTVERGLFKTRAPSRPNPIGISCVKLEKIDHDTGIMFIHGIDLLDGTQVLDIRPYVLRFDAHPDSEVGWIINRKFMDEADSRFQSPNQENRG
ncbi:SAM-dependent methyltransferase [Calditrichota bacterium]